MEKILIVEDDLALSAGICFELESGSYFTVAAYSVQKAKALLEHEAFQLAVLDVNLPDGNGFDLCRHIKRTFPSLPVVFLTANDLEEDVLRGFDMGAEDYITKPFSLGIFRKKVEVALRNGAKKEAPDSSGGMDDGFLKIDFPCLSVWKAGEKLSVTPNEFKILRMLTDNAGRLVTRRALLERLWDCDENYIDDHTLTVNVTRLRNKLEDESHAYVKTIRGMGYIWLGGGA